MSAKKVLTNLLKLGVVVLLLWFLSQKGLLSLEATAGALKQWPYIVPAFLILFFCAGLGGVRWFWLLRALGIELPLRRVMELTWIGMFFNNALPGAVSGDVVKAVYVAQEVPGVRGKAFGSILFDRIIGLSALTTLSAIAYLVQSGTEQTPDFFRRTLPLIALPGLAMAGFYVYLFLVKESHDPVMRLLTLAEKRVKPFGSLKRIYEGVRYYHQCRSVVFRAWALSVFIHILVSTACLLLLLAMNEAFGTVSLDMRRLYIAVPTGLLFTAIPIAPAGIGTGHAAFGWLFSMLGINRGADLFSLYAILQLVIGALGGLVYLRYRKPELVAKAQSAK